MSLFYKKVYDIKNFLSCYNLAEKYRKSNDHQFFKITPKCKKKSLISVFFMKNVFLFLNQIFPGFNLLASGKNLILHLYKKIFRKSKIRWSGATEYKHETGTRVHLLAVIAHKHTQFWEFVNT